MWPSAYLHGVGTPVRISISRLNTRPACSPVNASPPQLPAPTHDSGPLWVATPSTFRTCIYCTAPISPAHGEKERGRLVLLKRNYLRPVLLFRSWLGCGVTVNDAANSKPLVARHPSGAFSRFSARRADRRPSHGAPES